MTLLAGILVLKVTASVLANYPGYIPPDFHSDFLRGRERDFLGVYPWAFYTHILSGPVALTLGLLLVGDRLRNRWPQWHRRLGWVQAACVLGLVAPSGLVMAFYAAAGPVAGLGLGTLAIATAVCIAVGVRSAVRGRFADHRRWMWRGYLLLCSAVVIRLLGGFGTVTGLAFEWVDVLAAWVSWLLPLGVFEVRERMRQRGGASWQRQQICTAENAENAERKSENTRIRAVGNEIGTWRVSDRRGSRPMA